MAGWRAHIQQNAWLQVDTALLLLLAADVAKAHRRTKSLRNGWKYGGYEVGTSGVASSASPSPVVFVTSAGVSE